MKKKEDEETQPSEERKKNGQKLRLKSDSESLHVVLFTEMSLSDENRVMVVSNRFLVIGPTIFELWVMKTDIWVMEIDKPNTP